MNLANAQYTISYQSADSITYIQFINKDFKALHHTVKLALRNDIDFFYLRMRMGISYYEKKNYEAALPHFKRAYSMNPADVLAKEYLYYSLLFTNRSEDAHDLAVSFSKPMQEKIQFNNSNSKSTLQSISVSGGAGINSNISSNKNTVYSDSEYIEKTLQGNTYLANVALQYKLSNRLKLYSGLSYYHVKSLGTIHTALKDTSTKYANASYQGNVGMSYRFKNELLVGGTFGCFIERSNYFTSTFDTSNYSVNYSDTPFDHIAYNGALHFSYRYKKLELGLSFSHANLSALKQYQGEAVFVYYPLGNQHLYAVCSAAIVQNDKQQNFIFKQCIGTKLTDWLWAATSISYGNHQNYIPSNGFVAYNTFEPIQLNVGANLLFKFRRLNIIPTYTLQQKESTYLQVDTNEQIVFIRNTYFNHLFTTSLQWNF